MTFWGENHYKLSATAGHCGRCRSSCSRKKDEFATPCRLFFLCGREWKNAEKDPDASKKKRRFREKSAEKCFRGVLFCLKTPCIPLICSVKKKSEFFFQQSHFRIVKSSTFAIPKRRGKIRAVLVSSLKE